MGSAEIFITKDGSHSILNKELNETYHSVHGAVQESSYVFIQQGLHYWLETNSFQEVSILEVGFGTGLNALLTLQAGLRLQTQINYATIEAYPLDEKLWSKLNYANDADAENFFRQLHECPWEKQLKITPNFSFVKYFGELQKITLAASLFDVIFYDAFAPSKQAEMWSFEILQKVSDAMRAGGVFVTYCAKGQLKRDLKTLGLSVETLPGPPGKKEMIRATKSAFSSGI